MEKKKYFVSLQSREISQTKHGNNADFTIYATDAEVTMLRHTFDRVHVADMDSFWRAHVPIVPYHLDSSNDRYDKSLSEVFEMIYDLGDDEARTYIKEAGVLSHRRFDIDW